MKFWIILICVIISVLSYPFLRFLIKRIILSRKIKKLCKEKGFTLHRTHLFWMLSGRNYKKCDFYIEAYDSIYCVKLFNTPKWSNMLLFTDDNKYFFREIITVRSTPFYSDKKLRTLPLYDFRVKYKDEWGLKTFYNVLLVHPVCHEIRKRTTNGVESILGARDVINRMEIYSLARFIGRLKTEKKAEDDSINYEA